MTDPSTAGRIPTVAGSGTATVTVPLVKAALAFADPSNLLEGVRDVPRLEPDLADAMDVGELLTAALEQDDRLGETEATLEQADLVHHV